MRKESVALEDVVRAAAEISRQVIDAHGHVLAVEVLEPAARVHGDRVRLTQIVANLLNNAAKYTPNGGRIVVRVGAEGGVARVAVEDNGIGVPQDAQEGIFEMFRRGDRPMERLTSGLGIGLGLSRRLAQLHGGTIELFSAGEGQGSRFTLQLPRSVEVAPAPQPPAPARSAPQKVLVVDDNHDAALSLAVLLRALGHDVHTANDGAEALRLATTLRPDTMVLDLGMPAPDGFEVARIIRREPWGTRVRLVALSGWGQQTDRQRSRDSGFDLHLVKPVRLEEVRSALGTGPSA